MPTASSVSHLGANRYSITVAPPVNFENQTAGADDHLEAATTGLLDYGQRLGLDTELVKRASPCRGPSSASSTRGSQHHHRQLHGETVLRSRARSCWRAYFPGQAPPGQLGRQTVIGHPLQGPLDRVRIALNDFDNGDQVGFTMVNNADGTLQHPESPKTARTCCRCGTSIRTTQSTSSTSREQQGDHYEHHRRSGAQHWPFLLATALVSSLRRTPATDGVAADSPASRRRRGLAFYFCTGTLNVASDPRSALATRSRLRLLTGAWNGTKLFSHVRLLGDLLPAVLCRR